MSTTATEKLPRLAKPVRKLINRKNQPIVSFTRRDACLATGQWCKQHNPAPERRQTRGH